MVGCEALGHLLFQSGVQRIAALCMALTKRGAVARLLEMLYAPDLKVAIAAAKALRNFAIVGGQAGSQWLINADAPTILLSVFGNNRIKSATPADRKELFTHIFPLLASLSANEEGAVERFVQENLVSEVFTFMQVDQPHLLILEATSFLCVVSEDNPALANTILGSEMMLNHLHAMMVAPSLLPSVRTSAAGVLANIVACQTVPAPQILVSVISTLVEAISLDPVALASDLTALLTEEKVKMEKSGIDTSSGPTVIDESADDETKKKKSGPTFEQLTEEHLFTWKQSVACVKQVSTFPWISFYAVATYSSRDFPTGFGSPCKHLNINWHQWRFKTKWRSETI